MITAVIEVINYGLHRGLSCPWSIGSCLPSSVSCIRHGSCHSQWESLQGGQIRTDSVTILSAEKYMGYLRVKPCSCLLSCKNASLTIYALGDSLKGGQIRDNPAGCIIYMLTCQVERIYSWACLLLHGQIERKWYPCACLMLNGLVWIPLLKFSLPNAINRWNNVEPLWNTFQFLLEARLIYISLLITIVVRLALPTRQIH